MQVLGSAPSRRQGTTLIELLAILAILATLSALSLASLRHVLHSASLRSATAEVGRAFATARGLALASGGASVHLSATSIQVRAGGSVRLERQLGTLYGVTLHASRDSMAYSATGMGFGAANLRVVVRLGALADTLTVSRLGRVRY